MRKTALQEAIRGQLLPLHISNEKATGIGSIPGFGGRKSLSLQIRNNILTFVKMLN